MTQKELLYMEDAICHEEIIVNFLNEVVNMLEEEDLVSLIEKEIKKHSSMFNKLTKMLKEKTNE